MKVGMLLGERSDLLHALLDLPSVDVAAVARDRTEPQTGAPAGLARERCRWWPERGPGARERRDAEIAEWFLARAVDLVVAAGWLWILPPSFLDAFPDRIVNVHPTLLPAFPGRRSVERAVEHGVRVHGVTVHRIDAGVDTGPILAQAALPVDDGASAAEARRRLAPLERSLLAEVVAELAAEHAQAPGYGADRVNDLAERRAPALRQDLTRTNRFGGTALIPASDRGHVEMVRELLRTGIEIDHVNRLGWTALLEAVILGDGGERHQMIVRLLVDAGADVNLGDKDA